jgi:hypothetical protein
LRHVKVGISSGMGKTCGRGEFIMQVFKKLFLYFWNNLEVNEPDDTWQSYLKIRREMFADDKSATIGAKS